MRQQMLNLAPNQNNYFQLSQNDSHNPALNNFNQSVINDQKLPFDDAVNDSDPIIKDFVQHYQNLINTCDFKYVPKYGIQLAHSIARDVPNKYSIAQSIDIVKSCLLERNYDPKLMPERIIRKSYNRRCENIKKLNTIYSKLGLEPELMLNWDNQQIAARIKEVGSGIWIDNRGLGQGKTKLLEILRKILRNCGIAYITHRVSLVKDACTRLEISNYQDEFREGYHLGVCINSIKKHNIDTFFNVLFLDECRQIVEHAARGSVDNRSEVFDTFVQALFNADLIIASDADMNDETVNFLRLHSGGKKLHLIIKEPAENNKTIKLVKNFNSIFTTILNVLHAGENIIVACTSRSKAIELHAFLIENGIDIDKLLLVHSQNKGDIQQSEYLSNPNSTENATKYQCLIHSPTIGSGFSIEVPHYSTNFMLDSGNLPSNECLQMIARNRCADVTYYAFSSQNNHNRATDLELLTEGEGYKVQHYLELKGKSYIPTELGKMRINLESKINTDLNNHKEHVLMLADIKGMNIDYSDFNNAISDADSAKLKGLSAHVKEIRASEIKNAEIIDDEKAKALSKKPALTQSESNALNRIKTVKMVGSDDIDNNDALNFINGAMTVVSNVEMMRSNIELLKIDDRANHLTQDKMQSKTSLHKIFNELLMFVMSLDKIDKNSADHFCQILKKHAAELAANGFIDYRKSENIRSLQTMGNFLKKIGYKLKCLPRSRKNNRERLYGIEMIYYIERYVNNRAKNGTTNVCVV